MNRQQRRFQQRQEKKLNKQSSINNAFKFSKVTTGYPDVHNTFGCEVSNDYLNINQMKILKKIGLEKVLKITRRKKGMTSSGIEGGCHGNVYKLVNLYGGQQLLGYVLKTNVGHEGIRCLQLMWHSVWITPEGNLVDPTESINECEHTYFSPVKRYENDNVWTHGMDMLFPEEYETNQYILQGDSSHPEDEIRPFSTLCWKAAIVSADTGQTPPVLYDPNSGFKKPSFFTGKTYSETMSQMERVNKQ